MLKTVENATKVDSKATLSKILEVLRKKGKKLVPFLKKERGSQPLNNTKEIPGTFCFFCTLVF